jgi:hypothetical protein
MFYNSTTSTIAFHYIDVNGLWWEYEDRFSSLFVRNYCAIIHSPEWGVSHTLLRSPLLYSKIILSTAGGKMPRAGGDPLGPPTSELKKLNIFVSASYVYVKNICFFNLMGSGGLWRWT